MKILSFLYITFFLSGMLSYEVHAQAPAIPETIKANIRARINNGENQNIMIGVLDAKGKHYYSYGYISRKNKIAPKKYTLYEIGSISKVFTCLALAKAVSDGEVSLQEPLKNLIPDSVEFAAFEDKNIELVHLANHHSGLPYMPDNMPSSDPENPFVDYSSIELWEFLNDYSLSRVPGESYEYSNYAMGLLGYILAQRKGMEYEGLISSLITTPMGMADTKTTLNDDQQLRLSPGHMGTKQVKNWDFDALAGAGALRSTVGDLLNFLMYQIEFSTSNSLSKAIKLSHQPTAAIGDGQDSVALGWHITHGKDTRILWHNGQTAGYHSFMGFDKKNKRGIVVLANNSTSIDDIGFHFLDPEKPLKKIKEVVKLGVETLDQHIGVYQFQPGFEVKIRRNKLQLTAQLTGQSQFEIYPEAENRFFFRIVDAEIEFSQDDKGKTESLTLFQNGRELKAKRTQDSVAKEMVRTEISLSEDELSKFVGTYTLAPNVQLFVTQKGSQLYVKVTGQGSNPVYPESEVKFFYKIIDAQISFEVSKNGKVKSLTLHQGGLDQKAEKE